MALLGGEAVPLKTLLQYALGTNWALSCTGLAALAGRPDRAGAQAQVLAAFDRLAPYAMHYALCYFLTLPERPAPGAPFVNAKEWWRDNSVATMAARDYFDEVELWGDAPSFGAALDAVPAASYPVIRGFLERLRHPFASRLMQVMDAKQRAVVDRTFLCLVRPLLDGPRKARFARRARRLERAAPAGRNCRDWQALPAAVCDRRDEDREDVFPSPARQAPGAPWLDGIRGGRRRAYGRSAIFRAA